MNVVAFTGLALVAILQWRRRKDAAAAWAAASLGTLAVVVLLGRVLPQHPHLLVQKAGLRLEIVILLFFPYLLYRFTAAFDPPSRRLTRIVTAMTMVLVGWTLVLPHFPEPGEPRPAVFVTYLVAFLIHWTVLAVVVAWRLWRAGRGQPSVARRRMQMLSFGAAALTVALLVGASTTDTESAVTLVSGLIATVSALGLLLGLAPPAIVRVLWRRPETAEFDRAVSSLMQLATSPQEVAARVLAPMAAIVGARAVAIRDADGDVVGTHGVPELALPQLDAGSAAPQLDAEAEVVDLEVPGGSLVVWTSRYAPFFGGEELRLLRTLGALTGLALDRARLFAHEHESRVALERADEVKSNFIALAAHELRTPVASAQGIAQTITHLRGRLAPAQQIELENAMAQSTDRLASLVEQLLDLSRLDADAIPIEPEPFDVRTRIEELVAVAGDPRSEGIRIECAPGLQAVADRAAFDRIVSNLIANALRYGEAPIVVRAERTDRHFRIAVEDKGPGVEPDFVPDLFERFSRSNVTRERAGGTGLGLAIARSYAQAHRGNLVYEDAEPHGARFQLVLPAA